MIFKIIKYTKIGYRYLLANDHLKSLRLSDIINLDIKLQTFSVEKKKTSLINVIN